MPSLQLVIQMKLYSINTFKASFVSASILCSFTAFSANISTQGRFAIKSDDGKYSFKFNGRIQADAAVYNSDEIDLNNGTEIRRARFSAKGNIEDWGYKIQYDFISSEAIKDAHIIYKSNQNTEILIGSQVEAFGMEPQTSSNDVTFIERSTVIEAFGLNRAIGIAARQWGDNWTLNYGLYGQDVNHNKGGDEELGFNGRFNYAPINNDDKLISFGGSIAIIKVPDGDSVRFRARAESHQADTRIVNTDKIAADKYAMYALETAMKFNSITLLAEYIVTDVNSALGENANFDGFYLSASYLFNQKVRPYSTKQGKFKRITPDKYGLWEIAARFSNLDLNDKNAGVFGGQVDSITLGANYYINNHMRAMFNIVSANGDQYAKFDSNSLGARIQVTW